MTDTKKQSLLVVVLLVAIFGVSTTFGFTQEIKSISNEIAKRSFGVLEFLEKEDTWLTRFCSPIFTIITFFVSCYSIVTLISGWFGVGALPQLSHMPTEYKSGERDQRLLEVSKNSYF